VGRVDTTEGVGPPAVEVAPNGLWRFGGLLTTLPE
jgi:hypothetical protein